jgi:hypothetical protein
MITEKKTGGCPIGADDFNVRFWTREDIKYYFRTFRGGDFAMLSIAVALLWLSAYLANTQQSQPGGPCPLGYEEPKVRLTLLRNRYTVRMPFP